MFDKKLSNAFSSIQVNGNPISSQEDCKAVLAYIEQSEKRQRLARQWDELMANNGAPHFFALGKEPEEICKRRIPAIKRYLDWQDSEYFLLISQIEQANLNADLIFLYSDFDSEQARIEKALMAIKQVVPQHVGLAKIFMAMCAIESQIDKSVSVLSNPVLRNSSLCNSMNEALNNRDVAEYSRLFQVFSNLYNKKFILERRKLLLNMLGRIAPGWALAVSNRDGVHGDSICPDNIEAAWKWKQFYNIIEDLLAQPLAAWQREQVKLSVELRQETAKLVSLKAWYHLLIRTEKNLDMKQALTGWKLTVKKIGKGTGKNAPSLKRQAREQMAKCQAAVPAWIMPISRALDNLDPAKNRFDVVIIDEASQSDISALAIVYMADKAIVVGDDKQVSPMAVGLDIDKISALQKMYIGDVFQNWHLYDAKTSLYDIVGTTYPSLMLQEHFRCLPDIIGYSNKLSYDYKIKPLRDTNDCKTLPAVISYRVDDGRREGRRKTNAGEANKIVALLLACIEQPEYENATFGVISLLGGEQAEVVQKLLLEHIDPVEYDRRKILCGDASHFQGDERDIIFLSMVDNNEGDGPLALRGEGVAQSTKQRYNVAASRAKNQLWIIHSLDYAADLKPGDIRRDLLEYAENPQAYSEAIGKVETKAESPFEAAVGKLLVAEGYNIVQQWEIGAYRIDMVAVYQGRKIAIECDGERYHSTDDQVRSDMERQTILERLGWRFIRIRGSEYYKNPDAAIKRVIAELNEYGIIPEAARNEDNNDNSELLLRVKVRAEQILDEWHDNDAEQQVVPPPKAQVPIKKYVSPKVDEKLKSSKNSTYGIQMTFDDVAKHADAYVPKQASAQSQKAQVPKRISYQKAGTGKDPSGNTDDIFSILNGMGLSLVDNRVQSGIMWIMYERERKDEIEALLTQKEIRFALEKHGAIATNNKAAWRAMVQ
jgi:very-short-patch-repair endonuclease